MANASKSAKAPQAPKNGLGDLRETVAEVRAEIAIERVMDADIAEKLKEASKSFAWVSPRFTPDGILLNPEDFHIGKDGILTPRAH